MSKVIFFNVPLYGHINPTRELVKGLVEHGETVIYYSEEQFRRIISDTGASFRSCIKTFARDRKEVSSNLLNYATYLLRLGQELFENNILDNVIKENPDYIIHDQTCFWGKYISQLLNIPAACSNCTFAINRSYINDYFKYYNEYYLEINVKEFLKINVKEFTGFTNSEISEFTERLNLLRTSYGIIVPRSFTELFSNYESLNIIYTSRYFQPYAEMFDDRFVFVGPLIGSRIEYESIDFQFEKNQDKPLIYMALGTLYNENISLYKTCIEALSNNGYQVIIDVGDRIDISTLGTIPDNFVVKNKLPQLDILKLTDLFITHGGANSINEALFFNIPLIVIPQGADQFVVAMHVEKHGAGILIKNKDFLPHLLRKTVKEILSNDKYRINSKRIGDSLSKAGGIKRAVNEIFLFKKKNNIE